MKVPRTVLVFLFAALFLAGAFIRLENSTQIKRGPDEVHYIFYATEVLRGPLNAPRKLVDIYNHTPGQGIYPIPLRIGYYYAIAAVAAIFRLDPEHAGMALSTGCSILQLALVALIGARIFNPGAGLATLALMSVSPEDLLIARRVWGDGVSACVAVILIWICAEIVVRQRARIRAWFAAFWICGFYFLLLKETNVIFFGFCVAGLALDTWLRERDWKRVVRILAGAAATGVCAFVLVVSLCGGLPAALATVHASGSTFATNAFDISCQNGPWYSFPIGLWVLSPVTALGCGVAMVALLLPGMPLARALGFTREQRRIALGIVALIILTMAVASVPAGLKNLRFISILYGAWYLMAGAGIAYFAVAVRNRLGERAAAMTVVVAAALVVTAAFTDYARFQQYFIENNVPDLDIRQLMDVPFAPKVDKS